MNEHDDLISRLRAFGRRPVDPDLAARHLSAMAAPTPADAPPRHHRLRVVAAFAVGLLAGTTGLATAGALPNGAQEIAHNTLGSVGVKVPHGNRYQDAKECGGMVKNHGQYVRSQPKGNRAAAAASRCGKPLGAGAGDGNGAGKAAACQGPPPWAGKGKPDPAAKEARKQACGDHDDDDKADGDQKQKTGEDQTAPTPAPEAVQGSGPAPEKTPPSATVTPPVTPEPPTTTTTATATTSTTAQSDDTTTTTADPVPVPGLGS